jgi:hypothetical protein
MSPSNPPSDPTNPTNPPSNPPRLTPTTFSIKPNGRPRKYSDIADLPAAEYTKIARARDFQIKKALAPLKPEPTDPTTRSIVVRNLGPLPFPPPNDPFLLQLYESILSQDKLHQEGVTSFEQWNNDQIQQRDANIIEYYAQIELYESRLQSNPESASVPAYKSVFGDLLK